MHYGSPQPELTARRSGSDRIFPFKPKTGLMLMHVYGLLPYKPLLLCPTQMSTGAMSVDWSPSRRSWNLLWSQICLLLPPVEKRTSYHDLLLSVFYMWIGVANETRGRFCPAGRVSPEWHLIVRLVLCYDFLRTVKYSLVLILSNYVFTPLGTAVLAPARRYWLGPWLVYLKSPFCLFPSLIWSDLFCLPFDFC